MRHNMLERVQRVFIIIVLVAVLGIGLIGARTAGFGLPDARGFMPQGVVGATWNKQVAIISGHAGNDSGAVCEDENGNVTVTEAAINAEVAAMAAGRLRSAGADVAILEEYDPRLQELRVDALLSIHADSCIDASGYKAAYFLGTVIPDAADRLLNCVDYHYPAVTGLPHHPNTVTHNMTEYHAFKRIDPQTPAVIIELGFLGGDQDLLVNHADLPAKGVADALICFLNDEVPPEVVDAD